MSDTHHREFSELPISVDRGLGVPLPAQIAAAIRESIDSEILRPGEPLPATRELAQRLRVARGVVVSAYEQLIEEGYLSAAHGRGTRVHTQLSFTGHRGPQLMQSDQGTQQHINEPENPVELKPLAPGAPDTASVNTAAWRAAWRQAAARAHLEAPALGDTHLRAQISEHLRRMRGTPRPVGDVIVTAGAREGLSLLLTTLSKARGRSLRVGVEDPGYPSLRSVASAHGSSIVPLTVDAEGLDPSQLPSAPLDVVIVTPSHQYPLGASLPLVRRRELLKWAAQSGAVIVEDDYDSDLRHTGTPLPTLAALDDPMHGSVVLLGTFSKTVSPALAAGYLLAPHNLRQMLEPVRHNLGGPVSAVVQTALAEYLASGELRKHTTRVRRRYAKRRELVVERLLGVSGVRVLPMSGGLHAVVEFMHADAATEEQVVQQCEQLGPVPLSAYWQGQRDKFGLVIGTGGSLEDDPFAEALDDLRSILLAYFE